MSTLIDDSADAGPDRPDPGRPEARRSERAGRHHRGGAARARAGPPGDRRDRAGLEAQADPRWCAIVAREPAGERLEVHREAARRDASSWAGPRPPTGPAFFVRDDGAGFDMAHAGQAVPALPAAARRRTEFEGTGIGLATVHRIVARHGGPHLGRGGPRRRRHLPLHAGRGSLTAEVPAAPRERWSSSTLVRGYLIIHVLSLIGYWFVPIDTWPHPLWQMLSVAFSAAFMVVGARRLRPEASLGWYFIAAGVFLNAWGVVVDLAMFRFFGVRDRPNLADAFWSAQFPAVVLGLSLFARRAAAREELAAMLRNTVICVPVTFFVGIYAWQLIAWRVHQAATVSLTYKIVVSAYPFGNLMYLVLLLRLALSVGVKNVSLLLMLGWLLLLLPSDLGWPIYLRMQLTAQPRPSSTSWRRAGWRATPCWAPPPGTPASARSPDRSTDRSRPWASWAGSACWPAFWPRRWWCSCSWCWTTSIH